MGIAEYARYIEAQLGRQEERRRSLEARGVAVITSSGTLATLLLGLIAIATKGNESFELPSGARLPLSLALVFFAIAAGLSILTNVPRKADEASVGGLRRYIEDRRADTEETAIYEVAKNRLAVLGSARKLDRFKARALIAAMCAETAALICLAWAMIEII